MYSVEDLLISHGYKPSRDLPEPRDDEAEGRQQARARTRAGHGLLNGYDDGPAALAQSKTSLGKGHVSDSKSCRSAPRGHREPQSASSLRTSEAGFYDPPISAWSSQPQTSNDQAYWRRGQEVSSLLSPRDREDLEGRGMAQAHSLPLYMREGPWEVGARTENVMMKAVWEEELRMSGPAKWQNVSLESWSQPRKLGRQMSDGGGEKLFQDLCPFTQGEPVLNPQNKSKSQSLPRGLSPESLGCTEIPIPLSDGHVPVVAKMPLHPPNCAADLQSTSNLEKGSSLAPLPRPKFGRPLKPPSYGSHQHFRGGAENCGSQDSPHTDPYALCFAKTHEPRHEPCVSDSGLEPPMYVPPPSYRSPPEHIPNPYLEDPVPRPVCGGRGQQHLPEASASSQPPSGALGTGDDYGTSPLSPQGFPPRSRPAAAYDGFVQYIPFDDPRIRHIKLAQLQGFCEQTKLDDKLYDSGPVTPQEPARGKMQHDGALLNPQGLIPPSGNERGPAFADISPRWLWGQPPSDRENDGIPDQRDPYVERGQRRDMRCSQHGPAEGQVSSPNPQSRSTCETRTKLKKFEAGIQTKKSSKKKVNETIFCLVSIPVKSESHLPDIDTNNNDLKQSADPKNGCGKSAALREQSLLSTSSTDLELQALTGSMAGRAEFPKQELGEPEENKRANDLGLIHLTKHRELKSSGSWPGHQYRDQQTQTSFPEESKSSKLLPVAELGGPRNATLSPKSLDLAAPEAQAHTAFTSRDQKQRPDARNLKSQVSLSPSSTSAFSRTSSCTNQAPMPKAGPSQPCVDVPRHRASPVPKPEVVKGETTGPCNSQQPFGQFLLKPVSRRPWDLISQLESFNKELQEEEESSHSSSDSREESEAEQQWGDCADPRPTNLGFCANSPERRVEQQLRMLEPENPVFRSERVKRESWSWAEERKPGHPRAHSQSPGPVQVEESRGHSLQPADVHWMAEVGNGMNALAVSPRPLKRMMSRSRDTKPVPPSYLDEPREPQESQTLTNAVSSVNLSKVVPPEVDSGQERGTVVPLALTSKNRGLSAPDLRSVGLTVEQEQGASKFDGYLGESSATEIPPGESLQARAARILGIEVAVESLLPGARRAGQSHPPKPEASACSPESPREEPLPSSAPADGPTVSTDAFYGRRKCGWTKSPLFVGERDSTRWAPQASDHSGEDGVISSKASSPEPQPDPSESKSFDQKDVGPTLPFKSTLFHFIEKSPSMAGSEKRLRSPSKVIESLQEKLASPQRKADPDRLMRMKEVCSVSRMRFLSFRNSDSLEEAEEAQATWGQAWQPGGRVSLSGGKRARRLGHSLSFSKDIISREENRHLAAQREKKKDVDPDFWCPDSYDPSRVERV
ncbi:PREDICTED: junctional protein associated with coronary artery disease [Galeopterus variegatus]|uniref:Junctional protein associated with coronary artery disease n=1 Tax=Galeopterus variegatus TaxID=482537 RepID=A0ABM0RT01_GALVR|nr:PREDICTED: junctional protein associated with coronary artery disease [Galeopterus variegatus]XP_008583743.1 PREDICTED: junctional protein associated with coronary artery disease [Galeopterus variegatus]